MSSSETEKCETCGEPIRPPQPGEGDVEWVHSESGNPLGDDGYLDDDGGWHDPHWAYPIRSGGFGE